MADVRIVLNRGEIRKLMKSPEIADVCEAQAERLTRATGVDYVSNIYLGKSRINAQGWTNDPRLKKRVVKATNKKHKKGGSWVTVNGQKKYIKGYYRKKKKKEETA